MRMADVGACTKCTMRGHIKAQSRPAHHITMMGMHDNTHVQNRMHTPRRPARRPARRGASAPPPRTSCSSTCAAASAARPSRPAQARGPSNY